MATSSDRFVLRDLPLAARLVLATFLISTGIGYFSALVQLHFQHATAGKLMPEADDAIGVFHGKSGVSLMEKLLTTDEGKPFNGSGTMRPAFFSKSSGWVREIKGRAKEKKIDSTQAEAQVRAERDGERLAIL